MSGPSTANITKDSELLSESLKLCQQSGEQLRNVLTVLETSDVQVDPITFKDIINTAITALDKAYAYEKKMLFGEEEVVFDPKLEAVPEEVKDWLSSTFTTKMASGQENHKRKFKSIANVIRVGILVDKLYRKTSVANLHIATPVMQCLKKINEWDFDVFALHEASNEQSLRYISIEVLNKFDLINRFKISMRHFENFLGQLMVGYQKYSNSYHNIVHGADVVQTVFYLLNKTRIHETLTDLEKFGCLVAAMIHDYEHTGTTNNYHIKTNSELALVYNDKSILENYHLSSTFKIMRQCETTILDGLTPDEYREFRTLVIDMVLATDMSSHFQQVKTIKHLLALPEYIDKAKALSLILHSADISHPCKPWPFHAKWTQALNQEFFTQGDKELELGLSYSPLCDRTTTLVPESQIGFITFIVEPCFQVLEAMMESILTYKDKIHSINEEKQKLERGRPSRKMKSTETGLSEMLCSTSGINVEKKLKNTPWNAYIKQNLIKWKEIANK